VDVTLLVISILIFEHALQNGSRRRPRRERRRDRSLPYGD
jgi:hypothetical protein